MADQSVDGDRSAAGKHLVLYDGVCGLCNRLVQFILARDRQRLFAFASLQSAVGRAMVERFGHDPDTLTSFYLITNYRQPDLGLMVRGRAALFVVRSLGWPWKAAGLLNVLPDAILDPAYDFVARHRYQVFGRSEQCILPQPQHRSRFVE